MVNAAELFFADASNYDKFSEMTFSLQLPYANQDGKAICVTIQWHEAETLCVKHKTHSMLRACDTYYVITPKVAAAHMVFQVGCEPL